MYITVTVAWLVDYGMALREVLPGIPQGHVTAYCNCELGC